MELRKQSQFALKPKLKILDIQYVSSFFHSIERNLKQEQDLTLLPPLVPLAPLAPLAPNFKSLPEIEV